jgi:hypothetical protein
MNNIKTPKIYTTNKTYRCRYFRVFSASLHVGRIPFTKSIRFLHVSLMLNKVFGRKVPLSSSLTVSNIVDILDGGTLTSKRTFRSFISCLDMSLWERDIAQLLSLG